ncbi:MAG: CapA family protein [Firmicutes bacterium]|nr:CapA family protein [Bacillota bacterium]
MDERTRRERSLWEDDRARAEARAKKNAAIKKRKQQMKRRRIISMIVAIVLIFSLVSCGFKACTSDKDQDNGSKKKANKKEEAVSISLLCVGDVMAHSPNIKGAYDDATGTYDFTRNYHDVTAYISEADLALCNVETTFKGGNPSGYPLFNAPDSLATALAGAGFDVAITANNHMMDTGHDGMQRTLQVLRDAGMATVGSRYEGEKSYTVVEAEGVKIGVVAYTYETTFAGGSTTINGNPVYEKSESLINSFSYHDLESTDYARMQADIDGAKADGAEIIVCYFHWGEEYQREPNMWQESVAVAAANMGADVIFASHPHVLQGTDVLTTNDGRSVPVFYSMGNFISNQRQETLNNRYTEQGMIARVDIEYMKSTGEILSKTMSIVPTWVDKYGSGKPVYAIVPLDENLQYNYDLSLSGHMSRAQQALEDIRALVGDELLSGKTILTGGQNDDGTEQSGSQQAA